MGLFRALGLGALGSFAALIVTGLIAQYRNRRRLSMVSLRDVATVVAPGMIALDAKQVLDRYSDQITFVFEYFPYSDWGGNSRRKGIMYLTLRKDADPADARDETLQQHVRQLFPDREFRLSEFVMFRATDRWTALLDAWEKPKVRTVNRFLRSIRIDEDALRAHFLRVAHRPSADQYVPPPAPVIQREEEPVLAAASAVDDDPPPVREVMPFRGRWTLVRTGRWIEIRQGPGGCDRQDVFFGTYTFVDREGKTLGDFTYAEDFGDNHRALVERDGKRGYIDENGVWDSVEE
jgi:hypothetical protein